MIKEIKRIEKEIEKNIEKKEYIEIIKKSLYIKYKVITNKYVMIIIGMAIIIDMINGIK